MSQFVVYANADSASKRQIPFWLNVQSDLIAATDSRVMVPLITTERAGKPLAKLMPEFAVAGKRMVMDTVQITHVPMQMLGRPLGDLSGERLTIVGAIDMLISGI